MRGKGILSLLNIESAFVPVDMSGAANNGDWVSLEEYESVAFILFKDIGTAGEDPVFTVQQATSAAGAGAKALNFTEIFKKVGATALTGVDKFSRATQAAGNTHTDAASGENEAIMVVDIAADQLDVAGGFKFVQLSIPDTGAGAGALGCGFYLLYNPRFPQDINADAKA